MENKKKYIFTSESVTEGHPDKVCDQISDGILDAAISGDPKSRVAIETLVTTGLVVVAGEMTTSTTMDVPKIVRQVIKEIGYTDPSIGFDWENCAVVTSIDAQSPDISQGVSQGEGLYKEQGAGDQGMMFGYASSETEELMPLAITLAHQLTKKLAEVRKNKELLWLRPDGKSQVSVEYVDGRPTRVATVVISTQHTAEVNHSEIKKEVIEKIIKPVCGHWLDEETVYYVNPTGQFIIGGPHGDTGVTGRKIIADTYGGYGNHGGGAFSGKDPSKVDRSAAYLARYIAKNIVAAGIAKKCEVQLAYAIGVAEPVSLLVNTFGTAQADEGDIARAVRIIFPLKPAEFIEHLKLQRPIFRKTTCYGHFGRTDEDFTWEKTDKVDKLKLALGL
ncbi:MAG: methionine adenosyltransferase [Candidatus Buchananbacteria bacterium]|nr:methionine adenosyltransferase [Candidatus Buchananbacteria bacterium]